MFNSLNLLLEALELLVVDWNLLLLPFSFGMRWQKPCPSPSKIGSLELPTDISGQERKLDLLAESATAPFCPTLAVLPDLEHRVRSQVVVTLKPSLSFPLGYEVPV